MTRSLSVTGASTISGLGPNSDGSRLEAVAAWVLGILWIMPLLYAFWAAFHHSGEATRLDFTAPLTLDNFVRVWSAAPFPRYFLNTFLLVSLIIVVQFSLSTLAGYAFARFRFAGREIAFVLVLLQLMIMPDVLIVANYQTLAHLNLIDTILSIGLPYFGSAFGIFLMRQTFKSIPHELDEAARIEGAGPLQILWKVYIPLAKPSQSATCATGPICGA